MTHRQTTLRAPSRARRTPRITALAAALPLLLGISQVGCDDELDGPAGPSAGGGSTSGSTGSVGTGGTGGRGGTTSTGGTAGTDLDSRLLHQFCERGFDPDPRDALITSEPQRWVAPNGDVDLVLPQPVLDWMTEGVWQKSHDAWHNIRRCPSAGGGGRFGGFSFGGFGGASSVCAQTEMIPEDQECENASDGYQFLVMHRHMIQGLKQAFPRHTDLFDGFERFPFSRADAPYWTNDWDAWSRLVERQARVLDNVEQNLGMFPDEGALGQYIQCGGLGGGFQVGAIHGAMHFQWQVPASPHSLGKQAVNIENYMFWKLHGWIDDVWERYRVAKGVPPNDPRLVEELVRQCDEMHELGHLFEGDVGVGPVDLPAETGFFHEEVRPILETRCPGCHMAGSAQAGLPLTGNVSSSDIVAQLVGAVSVGGGEFKRIEPYEPEQSWLYLKVAGAADTAACTPTGGGGCATGPMPPGGDLIPEAELAVIRQWIEDGAPAPTRR